MDKAVDVGAAGLGSWQEAIGIRVESVKNVTARSRYVLIAICAVSSAAMLAVFDYMLSWNKSFAFKKLPAPDTTARYVTERILSEWSATQTFTAPVLGIKVMASDLALVGPPAFVVLSVWYFFSVRREHFTIGRLLGDVFRSFSSMSPVTPEMKLTCQSVYHVVISNMVFNVIYYDVPSSSLYEHLVSPPDRVENEAAAARSIIQRLIDVSQPVSRAVMHMLPYLTCVSIVFVYGIRLLTFVSIASGVTGEIHAFDNLDSRRRLLFWASTISSVVGVLVCWVTVAKAAEFNRATRQLLDDYQGWAFESVLPIRR